MKAVDAPQFLLLAQLRAVVRNPRPCLAGIWAVAIMSHLSLLQRVFFAWKRYRFVDPGALLAADEPADEVLAPDSN